MADIEGQLNEILANQKNEKKRQDLMIPLNIVVAFLAIWALGFSWLATAETVSADKLRIYGPIILVGGLLYVLGALYFWRWQGRKEQGQKK